MGGVVTNPRPEGGGVYSILGVQGEFLELIGGNGVNYTPEN